MNKKGGSLQKSPGQGGRSLGRSKAQNLVRMYICHFGKWFKLDRGQERRPGASLTGTAGAGSPTHTRGPFKGHLRLLPSVLRLGHWRDGSRFIALMALAEDLGIIF